MDRKPLSTLYFKRCDKCLRPYTTTDLYSGCVHCAGTGEFIPTPRRSMIVTTPTIQNGYCQLHDTQYIMECPSCVSTRPFVAHSQRKESEVAGRSDVTQVPASGSTVGRKDDAGKDEPSLLLSGCARAVAGIIAVLSFGFQKYKKRNGWKEVPEAKRRYKDALYRHMAAFERGELIDPESGKPHLDHVACNAVFLSELHHADGSYNTPPTPHEVQP